MKRIKLKRAIFIGVRYEACVAFCRIMRNYGYEVLVVTLKGSLIHKKRSQFKSESIKILPHNKSVALSVVYELLKSADYKILLSVGFPFILPKEFFSFKTLLVNSHPHLLPKYKGARVISESYKKKEKNYGVTTHWMTEDVDGGKILVRRRMVFLPKQKSDLDSLYELLFAFLEPAVVIETLAFLKQKALL